MGKCCASAGRSSLPWKVVEGNRHTPAHQPFTLENSWKISGAAKRLDEISGWNFGLLPARSRWTWRAAHSRRVIPGGGAGWRRWMRGDRKTPTWRPGRGFRGGDCCQQPTGWNRARRPGIAMAMTPPKIGHKAISPLPKETGEACTLASIFDWCIRNKAVCSMGSDGRWFGWLVCTVLCDTCARRTEYHNCLTVSSPNFVFL